MKPEIHLIVAKSLNNVIGKDRGIPWKLKSDMKRFRDLTIGHAVIMGRKTWETIRDENKSTKTPPLNGRENIVVSESEGYIDLFQPNLSEALAYARLWAQSWYVDERPKFFLIGGTRIYQEALERDLVDVAHITYVNKEVENGDAFFPEWDFENGWNIDEVYKIGSKEGDECGSSYIKYRRVR